MDLTLCVITYARWGQIGMLIIARAPSISTEGGPQREDVRVSGPPVLSGGENTPCRGMVGTRWVARRAGVCYGSGSVQAEGLTPFHSSVRTEPKV